MKDWFLAVILSSITVSAAMWYAHTSTRNNLLQHIYFRCETDGAVVFNDVVVQCIVHRAGAGRSLM
jgi:hypothetical protein